MLKNKKFWIAQNIGLVVFWLVSIYFLAIGQTDRLIVLIAGVILVAHVFETPLAFHFLKGQRKSSLKVIAMTLLFGYTWWMPARRGIYSAA